MFIIFNSLYVKVYYIMKCIEVVNVLFEWNVLDFVECNNFIKVNKK